MPVIGLHSVTLMVPQLEPGVRFYTDAGLVAETGNGIARLRCLGQAEPAVILVAGAPRKRLHHVALNAVEIEEMPAAVVAAGGQVIDPPAGYASDGLWVVDPNGMRIHLTEAPLQTHAAAGDAFAINGPGAIVRIRRSAMRPGHSYPPAQPLRLGHTLMFSPDVDASVAFVVDGLGMALADRSQDVIAFCCARKDSDHHLLAFAKSPGIGFHHVSFQVRDPDEVGRAGQALLARAGRGDWGFGRHTIGSNFFHYIQDPWGSWFEYYSDMDYIDDHALWASTNYPLEDSLANWGPAAPSDFVHNYECGAEFARSGEPGLREAAAQLA